jgi:citrate lyase subunit beta/citryl-CoA lyase
MSTLTTIHPRQALFGTEPHKLALPVCDHYAGIEERMVKSLKLQAEMAEKAGRAVFDVTLDLEDGAPVGGEAEQLDLVCGLINGPLNAHGRVGVRVHNLHHRYFEEDVDTLVSNAGKRLAYLMVPKLDGEADTARVLRAIQSAREKHGMTSALPVHGLIETHRGVQEVSAIARLPGLESLSFGLMDFVSEHRGAIPASAMSAEGQFTHPLILRAKVEVSAACHAAGLTPSHGVVTEFKDTKAVQKAATRAARELAYTRMWSIHPAQITAIVDAFTPVTAEVDDAVDILLAAQAEHWAPISHHGVLHDRASYRHHWYVLERAWVTGQPLPAEIESRFFNGA